MQVIDGKRGALPEKWPWDALLDAEAKHSRRDHVDRATNAGSAVWTEAREERAGSSSGTEQRAPSMFEGSWPTVVRVERTGSRRAPGRFPTTEVARLRERAVTPSSRFDGPKPCASP
jgi:hypothetical protein